MDILIRQSIGDIPVLEIMREKMGCWRFVRSGEDRYGFLHPKACWAGGLLEVCALWLSWVCIPTRERGNEEIWERGNEEYSSARSYAGEDGLLEVCTQW